MLELNKIYNMDCIEGMKQIEDDSVDITITSPPYNMGNSVRGNMYNNYSDNKKIGDYYGFINNVIDELIRVNKYYSFFNFQMLADTRVMWLEILHKFRYNIKEIIIWHKSAVQPAVQPTCLSSNFEYVIVFAKRKYCLNRSFEYSFFNNRLKGQLNTNVIYGNTASSENNLTDNKAIFPEYFVEWFISRFSKPGDLILDTFIGSGTTAAMAVKHQRQFIGFELNPEYHKIAEARIKGHMQQKKLNDML